jgi:hypothetical protein
MTLEPWETRAVLRILRDERVRQIAVQSYALAPLEKLIELLEAELPDGESDDH